MSTDREVGRRPAASSAATGVGLLLAAIAASALAALAIAQWRHPVDSGFGGVASGEYCSVLLSNGQIYYGLLKEVRTGHVRLTEVYYVQSVQRADGQRDNKLVNRQRNDWHSPLWQAIPLDKIVMIEAIGPDSAVAKLMLQDRAAPQGK
jgi:hypothetical protein